MKKSLIALLLTCIALQGCGVIIPGTPWDARPQFKGPMLFNGARSQVLWRCAAIDAVMSKGPCEIGYRDHHGEVVTLDSIKLELHNYLPRVALKDPVQLYILTISPTVVLAVPGRRNPAQCIGTSYPLGCQEYEKRIYQFGPRPIVGPDSFWFAPGLKIGPVALPAADEMEIKLPDSIIRMKAAEQYWEYSRS